MRRDDVFCQGDFQLRDRPFGAPGIQLLARRGYPPQGGVRPVFPFLFGSKNPPSGNVFLREFIGTQNAVATFEAPTVA